MTETMGRTAEGVEEARRRPVGWPESKDLASLLRSLGESHAAYPARYDTTLHPGDEMYVDAQRDGAVAYFVVGQSAVAAITLAMALAGKSNLASILDLPCGHGRVTRMLRARWPDSRIAVCDLLTEGVDFCARQFSAVPIHSHPDPAKIPTDERFDLIWSGSLLTHLDAPLFGQFLRFFAAHLAPDGLLVFSTLGRFAALHPPQRKLLRAEHLEPLRADYLANGFAYMDQTDPRCPWNRPGLSAGYGVTWASPGWVLERMAELPELRMLAFWERGWNEHQDLVVAQARPVGAPRRPLLL